MRPFLFSFDMLSVNLPGLSEATAAAIDRENSLIPGQSIDGRTGATTWRPLPPVVFR
jgi:hypothetical protein